MVWRGECLGIHTQGPKKENQTTPTPQTKGFCFKTNSGEYFFHTTRRKDVELTVMNGSEARKPLAFSKALNRLAPKIPKTKGNSWHLLAKEQKASYFSSVMNL